LSRPLALAALLALLGGTSGCAAARFAYGPAELRAEVARRAPHLPAAEIVVPYELAPEDRARAAEIVSQLRSVDAKVQAIVAAMFDPGQLGLRYADVVTGSAAETLRARRGNCLALASVFVGLARAAGLEAYYIDASTRVHETTYHDDGMAVSSGHVTAMVVTPKGNVGLDFAHLGPFAWYRKLDDVEALAHFYNNRAFERIDEARARGAAVDWAAAALDFRRATEVKPGFALAWSNLGMAEADLGHVEEAIRDYEEAIRRAPALVAPRNNLGALLLRRGDAAGALRVLEAAVALPSSGAHVLYNLALARLRAGERDGALEALRLARAKGYAPAQRLLDELALAPAAPRVPQ
jgi:tetratricopeptide (TPR) repeat protein